MSRKARWAVVVLGVAGACVVAGVVGMVVFRFGWTEPEGIEVAREAMQGFDHDSGYAHGEEDPFQHVYLLGGVRFTARWHRHCLVHDVNGDGDTADSEDNDGTCPGPDTDLFDLAWHQPLPDPGGPAKQSALKWGAIFAGLTAFSSAALSPGLVLSTVWADRQARAGTEAEAPQSADQPETARAQGPSSRSPVPIKERSGWETAVLCALIVSLAAVLAGLHVSNGRWSDHKNSGLASEFIRTFHHSSNFSHDEEDHLWHIYIDDDGRVSADSHRHCPFRDVNGDGDTEDPEDNDGICPGPDTGLPDLEWHPLLPNPSNPAWGDRLREAVFLGVGTAIALTAILAAVGIPWVVRKKRKLKSKEAAEAKDPPTTPAN